MLYKLSLDQLNSDNDGQNSTWYCDNQGCKGDKKGCKITTTGDELKLAYPHTRGMHKCNDYTPTEEMEGNAEESEGEEEVDGGMFSMFD